MLELREGGGSEVVGSNAAEELRERIVPSSVKEGLADGMQWAVPGQRGLTFVCTGEYRKNASLNVVSELGNSRM